MAKHRWLLDSLWIVLAVAILAGSHLLAARRWPWSASITATAAPLPVEPVSASAPAADPVAPLRLDPQQAMLDIMSLRAEHTEVADPAADAEFAAALRRVIEDKQGVSLATSTVDTADALRAAAQHFEAQAIRLETEKALLDADRARQTVAALRDEAHRLDPRR